jgi:hypothetical protein
VQSLPPCSSIHRNYGSKLDVGPTAQLIPAFPHFLPPPSTPELTFLFYPYLGHSDMISILVGSATSTTLGYPVRLPCLSRNSETPRTDELRVLIVPFPSMVRSSTRSRTECRPLERPVGQRFIPPLPRSSGKRASEGSIEAA